MPDQTLSSISVRPIPVRSGVKTRSVWRSFVARLTDAVLAYRRVRLHKYRIQRWAREHKKLARKFDDARYERELAKLDQSGAERDAAIREQDEQIDEMHPSLLERTVALDDARALYSESLEEAKEAAKRVYELEAAVMRAHVWPDRVPHLPPRLFAMLRLAKATARLLDDDREVDRRAEQAEKRSYAALDQAATRVLDYAGRARTQSLPRTLQGAVAALQRRTDAHIAARSNRAFVKAKMESRECSQRFQEDEIFTDVAGPILAAEGLVEDDILCTSMIDVDENGERWVYQNFPRHRLVDTQLDEYYQQLQDWREGDREAKEVARDVTRRFEAWQAWRLANPDAEPGHRLEMFEEALFLAQEMVVESENATTQLVYYLKEKSGLIKEYDMVDEDEDGRVESETSHVRAWILSKALYNPGDVDSWERGVPNSPHPDERSTISETWAVESVEGRATHISTDSMEHEDRPLRRLQLEILEAANRYTRLGLLFLQRSQLEEHQSRNDGHPGCCCSVLSLQACVVHGNAGQGWNSPVLRILRTLTTLGDVHQRRPAPVL